MKDQTGLFESKWALNSEVNKLTAIISAIGEGIAVMDTGFRVLYQSFIHQQRQGSHLGKECFRAFHGYSEPCPNCQLRQCFEDGRIHRRQTVSQTSTGWRHLEITASPLRDDRGTIIGGVEVVRDITECKLAQEGLRKSEENLRLLLESTGEGVFAVDLEGRCTICNPAAARMLGYDSPTELLGQRMHDLIHHSHPDHTPYEMQTCSTFKALREGRGCFVEEDIFWRKNGTWIPVEFHSHPMHRDGEVVGAVILFSDISRRLRAERQLQEKENLLNFLDYYDPLTNLPNRTLFRDRLKHALGQARRFDRKLALLFLDLDRYKHINDSFGHETGDQVLCEMASRLQSSVRDAETVARFGGDEFLVIVENLEDPGEAANLALDIQACLSQPLSVQGHEISVTSSVGLSIFPDDAQAEEGLLKSAEVAMYQAKGDGRSTYKFYRPEMNAHVQERLVLEGRLRQALPQGQFELHYQPQFHLTTGEPIGIEALLRWRLPGRGLVPPGDFIGLAEETGLIVPIGEWVLREACRQALCWQRAGYSLPLSVNISGVQFKQPGFVTMVRTVLHESGLEPDSLELEITESVVMEDVESTILKLAELKEIGIHLSLDDFGTGYSSLSYLKRFPIDKLKIDRSFVWDLQKSTQDQAIITSIIALARGMGLEIIAEGIERREHVEFLKAHQCLWGQGFLYSKPLSVHELTGFLRDRKPAIPAAS